MSGSLAGLAAFGVFIVFVGLIAATDDRGQVDKGKWAVKGEPLAPHFFALLRFFGWRSIVLSGLGLIAVCGTLSLILR